MSLPTRLPAGSHVLHVSRAMVERLSLFERLVSSAIRSGRRIVALVDPDLRPALDAATSVADLRPRQVAVRTVDDLVGEDDDWQAIADAIDQLVAESERNVSGWRLDEPESETLVFVDLDRVFARCRAASEMMSFVYALHHNHAARKRTVVEAISVEVIPRSIPTEFFDVHTDWVFAPATVPGADDGERLDASAQRIVLETPEFRNRFLALARTDPDGALSLVPHLFADVRRGIVLVDTRMTVRHCSPRAATLLKRGAEEIVDRPLNTVIDGVDFVTLKHECGRASAGTQSPFVVSWRVAPGSYEPREVTVDALTSEHRFVGYVISIAPVQAVRGPRAVYRELSEEQQSDTPIRADEDVLMDDEETLNDSLHGTQITRREHEVLLLILNNQSNRDIARHLNIAEVTVKKHLTSIYRKLRITNRSELVRSFEIPHAGPDGNHGASE